MIPGCVTIGGGCFARYFSLLFSLCSGWVVESALWVDAFERVCLLRSFSGTVRFAFRSIVLGFGPEPSLASLAQVTTYLLIGFLILCIVIYMYGKLMARVETVRERHMFALMFSA